jgi:hypothetical protein
MAPTIAHGSPGLVHPGRGRRRLRHGVLRRSVRLGGLALRRRLRELVHAQHHRHSAPDRRPAGGTGPALPLPRSRCGAPTTTMAGGHWPSGGLHPSAPPVAVAISGATALRNSVSRSVKSRLVITGEIDQITDEILTGPLGFLAIRRWPPMDADREGARRVPRQVSRCRSPSDPPDRRPRHHHLSHLHVCVRLDRLRSSTAPRVLGDPLVNLLDPVVHLWSVTDAHPQSVPTHGKRFPFFLGRTPGTRRRQIG